MSTSIVRKGLELFKDDISDETSKRQKRKNLASRSRKDLLPLIGSNKTGVKKRLKRLKGAEPRNKETVKDMKMKSAFDKLPKTDAEDHTDRNINYLLKLDRNRGRFASQTDKIIEHSRGKLAKDSSIPLGEEKVETSIFTEEDFTDFAKSYMAKRKVRNFLLDVQKAGSGSR